MSGWAWVYNSSSTIVLGVKATTDAKVLKANRYVFWGNLDVSAADRGDMRGLDCGSGRGNRGGTSSGQIGRTKFSAMTRHVNLLRRSAEEAILTREGVT